MTYEQQVQEQGVAWDCDPEAVLAVDTVDADLDMEDDEGDWQFLVLDRFHDRLVNPNW